MVSAFQHYMNPIHIYCRLRDLGVSKELAISLCRVYEYLIFKRLLVRG